MAKWFLKFSNGEIEKKKFNSSKELMYLMDINIKKTIDNQ